MTGGGLMANTSLARPPRRPWQQESPALASYLIFVVAAHPVGQVATGRLVAAPGGDVQQAVDAGDLLGAAGEPGIGVGNVPAGVPVKDAHACPSPGHGVAGTAAWWRAALCPPSVST